MRVALLFVTLAAACYQPQVPAGGRCSVSGDCPGGEPCVAGVCGGTEPGTDAPGAPDAAIDAPPGTLVITIGTDRSQLRDTEMASYDPGGNFGDIDHFSIDTPEVGLLWFDLSGVPGGIKVTKATLRLATRDDADEAGGTVLVYRVLEAWNEAEVTWMARTAGALWTTPGAGPPSREDTHLAELQPNKEFASFDVALPPSLVGAWLDDPARNHGLALVRGTSNQHVHFGSRESPAWSRLVLELSP
ncbi:MAG TPA: DNRLRE domain-containing protein [Kofleriaceae bacterium]|nr:DNRLRE domain-containing protein [Kofleriaceae bacterium]